MAKSKPMKTYSADELQSMKARGEDRSDLAAARAKTSEDIERDASSDPDDDVTLDWSSVEISPPRNKQGVFLRLDPDVVEHFKQGGAGYQTRINAVLRSYVKQKRKPAIKAAS